MMKAFVMGMALAGAVCAQTAAPKHVEERDVVFIGTPGGAGPMGHVMVHVDAQLVKGAPYAAESSTETLRVLSDGTRVSNKFSVKQYRDSEGRTRRDMNPENGPATSVVDDPVSGEHFILHHATKTATKAFVRKMSHKAADGKVTEEKEVRIEIKNTVVGEPMPAMGAGPAVMTWTHMGAEGRPNEKVEPLGKQSMEGVSCEGTKRTLTIEAGKMGNDRPIQIVTETWTAPELKLTVLQKTSDPLMGDTTMRVTNLVRSEQPRNLFEIPSDYKIEETPKGTFNRKIEVRTAPKQ
jgi:hypothetical protein